MEISKKILTHAFSAAAFFLLVTTVGAHAAGTDGACGAANSQSFSSAPTANLCSSGTPSAVSDSDGKWTWTCTGTDGCASGDSQSCTTSDSCAGKKYCTNGAWGACVKNDSSCGSNDYCNEQGQWCSGKTGQCIDSCSKCSCPASAPTCNSDGSCGGTGACNFKVQIQTADGKCISNWCSDGTAVNRCSRATDGLQCVAMPIGAPTHLELQPACQTCGCSGNQTCSGDGTCVASSDLPTSFNWASQGAVTSPKSQGNCGSCWAFAAVGAAESYNIIHAGASPGIDLSEQELLSCGGGGSCSGGNPGQALSYIKNKGIVTESCFPYKVADDVTCSNQCSPKYGYGSYAGPVYTDNLFSAVKNFGPIAISLGGIDHAVLMIGWSADGKICIKNSWGGTAEGYYQCVVSRLDVDGFYP